MFEFPTQHLSLPRCESIKKQRQEYWQLKQQIESDAKQSLINKFLVLAERGARGGETKWLAKFGLKRHEREIISIIIRQMGRPRLKQQNSWNNNIISVWRGKKMINGKCSQHTKWFISFMNVVRWDFVVQCGSRMIWITVERWSGVASTVIPLKIYKSLQHLIFNLTGNCFISRFNQTSLAFWLSYNEIDVWVNPSCMRRNFTSVTELDKK